MGRSGTLSFDEIVKRDGGRVSVLDKLKTKLVQHAALDLSEVSVFHPESNSWQGQLGVEDGLIYGPVEAVIPNKLFDTTILQGGSLLRLVLQSDSSHDIKEVLSPMAYSPLLERIKLLAQMSNILERIAVICQNYQDNSPPLELIFTHQQETTLAKLTLEPRDSLPTTGAPTMPYVDVREWCLSHIYESMQDSGFIFWIRPLSYSHRSSQVLL